LGGFLQDLPRTQQVIYKVLYSNGGAQNANPSGTVVLAGEEGGNYIWNYPGAKWACVVTASITKPIPASGAPNFGTSALNSIVPFSVGQYINTKATTMPQIGAVDSFRYLINNVNVWSILPALDNYSANNPIVIPNSIGAGGFESNSSFWFIRAPVLPDNQFPAAEHTFNNPELGRSRHS
jgi:hypothetical protein